MPYPRYPSHEHLLEWDDPVWDEAWEHIGGAAERRHMVESSQGDWRAVFWYQRGDELVWIAVPKEALLDRDLAMERLKATIDNKYDWWFMGDLDNAASVMTGLEKVNAASCSPRKRWYGWTRDGVDDGSRLIFSKNGKAVRIWDKTA